jgi:hypothetical protein
MDDPLDPYRLWYEALQRSDRTRWSKKAQDFLKPADGLPFDLWWAEVGKYFKELDRHEMFTVSLIGSQEELDGWWEDYGWDEDVKMLYVNLLTPTSVLEEEFGKLIRTLRTNRPGRPAHESFAPDFPMCRPPRVELIKLMLKCYDANQENGQRPRSQRLSLYELGVSTGVQVGYIVDDKRDDDREAEAKRVKMAVTFSRMVKRARTLISNVEIGIFPLY